MIKIGQSVDFFHLRNHSVEENLSIETTISQPITPSLFHNSLNRFVYFDANL